MFDALLFGDGWLVVTVVPYVYRCVFSLRLLSPSPSLKPAC